MTTPLAYVVEGNPAVSEVWQKMLQNLGFETNFAHDGLLASEFLHIYTPTLILLDMELAAISAAALLQQISATHAWQKQR